MRQTEVVRTQGNQHRVTITPTRIALKLASDVESVEGQLVKRFFDKIVAENIETNKSFRGVVRVQVLDGNMPGPAATLYNDSRKEAIDLYFTNGTFSYRFRTRT